MRRNMIWHAIRLSRENSGQAYLRETLVKQAKPAEQIKFLHTLKNPSLDDVQLIIDIYASVPRREKGVAAEELDDVREQVMRMASLDWKLMVVDGSYTPGLEESEAIQQRAIATRRQDRALEGQVTLLRWLVRNGTTDEHRLRAFSAVRRVSSWPNEWKLREETRVDEDRSSERTVRRRWRQVRVNLYQDLLAGDSQSVGAPDAC